MTVNETVYACNLCSWKPVFTTRRQSLYDNRYSVGPDDSGAARAVRNELVTSL
jgi:hypothetical protein